MLMSWKSMLQLREILQQLLDNLDNKLIRVGLRFVPEEKFLGFILDKIPLSVERKQSMVAILGEMASSEGVRIIDLVLTEDFKNLIRLAISLTYLDRETIVDEIKLMASKMEETECLERTVTENMSIPQA